GAGFGIGNGDYLGVSLPADAGHVSKIGRGPSMYEMEGPRLALRLRRRSLGDRVLRGQTTSVGHPP
ncbi:MAG TPA: hypothetical protein VGR98_18835, partial [Streptosporangiaceae bacterium]|nr:hypothetical protein [Streptosporangiaceae bacterium]